jgi:hypothetical protein
VLVHPAKLIAGEVVQTAVSCRVNRLQNLTVDGRYIMSKGILKGHRVLLENGTGGLKITTV